MNPPSNRPGNRSPARSQGRQAEPFPWVGVVFALALFVRMMHALAMQSSVLFAHPVLDAHTYREQALSIAAGNVWPKDVFWQAPGYPYFLGVLSLFARDFLTPRLVQSVLGAGTCVLVVLVGRKLFEERVAVGAGLAAALYGPLIFFDGELLTPSLGVFLQLVALWLALRAREEARPKAAQGLALLTGAVAGLAALVIATYLLVVPVLAAALRRRAPLVLLGAALAVLPVTLSNWIVGKGQLVLISANGGINLYIGNNPDYDRTVGIRPGEEWWKLVNEPRKQGGAANHAEASRYFTDKVLSWARAEPVAFLALQAKKAWLLVGGNEIPRNHEIYPARDHSWILRLLMWKVPGLAFPFGLLFPLAALGMAVAGRRVPLLAAGVGIYAAGVVAFFICARYRIPLVPVLLLFAAEGVRWLVAAAPRARTVGLGALLPLFLAANLGQGAMATEMNADADYQVAEQLLAAGRHAEAIPLLRATVHKDPTHPEAWYGLGTAERTAGSPAEAARAFEALLKLKPNDFEAMNELAVLRAEERRFDEAIALLQRAVQLSPKDDVSRRNLERIRADQAAWRR